jgi:excinuclease ABC subunit C
MSFDSRRTYDLPKLPGVYLMKDAQGRVLYVGKARDLRTRVRSYFRQGSDGRWAIRFLLQRLHDMEVVVTQSEKEALILENSLIKKHRPRYNVAFRDDKSYFHIRMDTSHPFPRASLVRRPQRDGALYFGPYASSHGVRQTLRLLQRHMGIRTCKDSQLRLRRRTCLNFQMGRCAGVCRGAVSAEEYAARVQDAILFLHGKSKQLLDQLQARMKEASSGLRFEEAARIRDQILAVQRTLEGQRVVTPLGSDRDVLGLHREGDKGTIVVLQVREGKVLESRRLPLRPTFLNDEEVVSSFLKQYYDTQRPVPPEILLPVSLEEETGVLEQWLGEQAGSRVRIRCPRRGEAKGLVEMAQENARHAGMEMEDPEEALAAMAQRLHLRRLPRIAEGFDISTLGGEGAVGSAVRFVDGAADRRAYRSYGIRTVEGVDDYAMMYELLQRHLRRRREEGDLPDLLVMDGGKGQLGVALAVMDELGLTERDAVALAKGRGRMAEQEEALDHVFIPGRKEAISMRRDAASLRLLQRLRDEAHRFAVTRHRKRRGRRRMASVLDAIPGVGQARKKALLKQLGSLQKVRDASVEELARVPGISRGLAQRIFEELRGEGGKAGKSEVRSQRSDL